MRLLLGLLAATILGGGVLGGIAVEPQPAATAVVGEWQQRYDKLGEATRARDIAAISAFFAPDYVDLEIDGSTMGLDAMLSGIRALPIDPNQHSGSTVLGVDQRAGSATVETRYTLTTVKASGDGSRRQSIEFIAFSTDEWLEQDGRWLVVRSTTNEMSYSIDGREMKHLKRTPAN